MWLYLRGYLTPFVKEHDPTSSQLMLFYRPVINVRWIISGNVLQQPALRPPNIQREIFVISSDNPTGLVSHIIPLQGQ